MRVLILYDGDYPWDVRIEKMARTLAHTGHGVAILARNRANRPRTEVAEGLPGVTIHRLPHGGKAEPLLGTPVPMHPVWLREALRVARAFRPDRILARDLPLAPVGLSVARRTGARPVLDFAEPYPEALRSNWQFDALGGTDHLLKSPRLADALERWVLRRQPRVLVVCPEAGARLERRGLAPGRWTVVHNTPDLAWWPSTGGASPVGSDQGTLQLLFTGILVGDRGVEVAIEALARLVETAPTLPPVELHVVGEGPARPRYQQAVRRLGLTGRVHFHGWVAHHKLPELWSRADLGLLPFHRCSHIDATLANKLFDYMAAGLPVLASDAPPMVRILHETGAGSVFRGGDPRDLAAVARGLLADRQRRWRMGEAGRRAVRERYSWAHDAERLLAAIEQP